MGSPGAYGTAATGPAGRPPPPAPAIQARIDAARARGGAIGLLEANAWRVVALGKPLLLGMFLMACTFGTLAWATASAIWHWRVRRERRRRLRARAGARPS